MAKTSYFISSPHTKEECLAALDAVSSRGPEYLNQWYFGCQAGDHTGYAIMQANNEAEIRNHIPENVRAKAYVTKVEQYNQQQIRQFHQMQPTQAKGR